VQAVLLDVPDSGLPLARNLSRRAVPVTILTDKRWVASTRWAEGRVLGQLGTSPDAWLQRLDELAGRGPGVLVSGSDVSTEFLVEQRDRIPAELRSFEAPGSQHMRLMDKGTLYEIADRAGVRYPRTQRLATTADLEAVREKATFPCLIKPSLSHLWRGLFGERRVLVVNSPVELANEARPALDAGLELLVSEHVPGPDTNLEAVVLIRRGDGSVALRYGRRKVRMYPPGYGAGSIHEATDVPETSALTESVLAEAGFVGLCNGEVKRHADTGERVLIEVNVRLPRGWALGDASGVDASWRLYATLAGIPLQAQPQQQAGVRIVVPALELRAAVVHLRERRLTPRQLLEGYRGVRDLSGLSWRDPLPVLLLLADFAKWIGRYVIARLRRG
jgi:predicted ATP-grasp superfamily ATP-dependent carboligase